MIDQTVERFARQLTHQIGGFRDDVREGEAALHTELRVLEASLRKEIASLQTERRDAHTRLRVDLGDIQRAIARDLQTLSGTLSQELAGQRRAQLRWAVAVSLGQVAGLIAVLTLLLRT